MTTVDEPSSPSLLATDELDVCEDVVLDGELVKAREFIRTSDVIAIFQLRSELAAQDKAERSRAYCPYCLSRLGLAGSRDDSGGARATSMHFRHPSNPEVLCPQKSAHHLSPDLVRAMKYLGQRESSDHRWMKAALAECLKLTPDVVPESVLIEQRFASSFDDRWRQPDVRAEWHAHSLVFEAQLDTTHVSVIAARDTFYRQQDARLVWVFARPPTDRLRFVEKDILFTNHHNLFVFNEECRQRSLAAGRLVLLAWWIKPEWVATHHERRSDVIPWQHAFVDLTMLTFDDGGGAPYYVDVPAQALVLERQGISTPVKVEQPQWAMHLRRRLAHEFLRPQGALRLPDATFGAVRNLEDTICTVLRNLGQPLGNEVEERQALHHFIAFARAMQALEDGHPSGFGLKFIVQVESWMFDHHKPFYRLFCYALRHANHHLHGGRLLSSSQHEKHRKRMLAFKRLLDAGDASTRAVTYFGVLIDRLWPWIAKEMQRPTHRDRRGALVAADIITGQT
jgi:Family of unknown function (DUF6035)